MLSVSEMGRSAPINYFDFLSNDLVMHIFSYLPEQRHRSACACVCKSWLFVQSQMHFHHFRGAKEEKCPHCSYGKGLKSSNNPWRDVGVKHDGLLIKEIPGKVDADFSLASAAVAWRAKGGLDGLIVRQNFGFTGFTYAGMKAIGLSCRTFRHLELYSCKIGDKGLKSIALCCRSLIQLELTNCHAIGDAGLLAISQGCVWLNKLLLNNCPRVTDVGISDISKGCKSLNCLILRSCPSISDVSLSAISRGCLDMRTLVLDSCDRVGDYGLEAIASSCSKLSGLVVTNCRLIGNQGISAATSKCKKIKILVLSSETVQYSTFQNSSFQMLDLDHIRQFDRNSKFLVNLTSLHISDCKLLLDSVFLYNKDISYREH